MSDEIREQLSALIDDELSDLERPLLLGRLQRDIELRECLGRYQLIGEVLRGDGNIAALHVARGVREAVEGEAVMASPPAQPAQRSASHWKPLAGVGVAASVALLALLGITTLRDSGTETTPMLASGETVPRVAGVGGVPDGQWDRIEPRIEERLSGYLVNHSEYAASRAVQGVMPYVRIVGFDNE